MDDCAKATLDLTKRFEINQEKTSQDIMKLELLVKDHSVPFPGVGFWYPLNL